MNSSIPAFIPFLCILGVSHAIFVRVFSLKYFYGTITGKLSNNNVDNIYTVSRTDALMKIDPKLIDWGDMWTIGLNLFFRCMILIVFFFGTTSVVIRYI